PGTQLPRRPGDGSGHRRGVEVRAEWEVGASGTIARNASSLVKSARVDGATKNTISTRHAANVAAHRGGLRPGQLRLRAPDPADPRRTVRKVSRWGLKAKRFRRNQPGILAERR